MIEMRHVCKSFRDKVAVDDLTLSIPAGSIFGFLGPNGAGKTTTIRILTGLLRADRGEARIAGEVVSPESAAARAVVGYIPDQPYLYDKLTGHEFLDFVGALFGMDERDRQARIAALAERFEVTPFLHDLAETYSHGMRQRLVFCSAFLHRPKVLIVDEPMVGLDPRSIRLVKDTMRREARQGLTVFMSTHTLSWAEELCDRIGIINQGRLVAHGTPEEIRRAAEADGGGLEEAFLRLTSGGSPTDG